MATPKARENVSIVPEDIEKGARLTLPATSALQQQAQEIRTVVVDWPSYVELGMISQEHSSILSRIGVASTISERAAVFKAQPRGVVDAFYAVITNVSKEQTLAFALTLLDDLLQEEKTRVELFQKQHTVNEASWAVPLLQLLNRPGDRGPGSDFSSHMCSRVLAKMACWSSVQMYGSDLQTYLIWLRDQLKLQNNEYVQSVCRCLQMVLRIDPYRLAFVHVDGIAAIVGLLVTRLNFQLQYQLVFCLWVLTFNAEIAAKMGKYRVIPIIADILTDTQKEKVSRIILALFVNLIEKPDIGRVVKEHCIAMVQCKVLKQIEYLEHKKFEDEDIRRDIDFLRTKMEGALHDLSSFDEYVTELNSGRLEWSPVHRSDIFWRDNVTRFNDANYQLLRCLISLLETSDDSLVLSVAAFDLGEYVRHYARGKHVVENLGGKTRVMALLGHADPNVRYEALLAVQKLMVHNWEYLGRQLEKEQGQLGQDRPIKAS